MLWDKVKSTTVQDIWHEKNGKIKDTAVQICIMLYIIGFIQGSRITMPNKQKLERQQSESIDRGGAHKSEDRGWPSEGQRLALHSPSQEPHTILKADSHTACRTHAVPMPFVNSHMPCRAPVLLRQCRVLCESPHGSRKYPNCSPAL
jgi:hypothetical protein